MRRKRKVRSEKRFEAPFWLPYAQSAGSTAAVCVLSTASLAAAVLLNGGSLKEQAGDGGMLFVVAWVFQRHYRPPVPVMRVLPIGSVPLVLRLLAFPAVAMGTAFFLALVRLAIVRPPEMSAATMQFVVLAWVAWSLTVFHIGAEKAWGPKMGAVIGGAAGILMLVAMLWNHFGAWAFVLGLFALWVGIVLLHRGITRNSTVYRRNA